MTADGTAAERLLRWIPAVAALGVAALYSVGALLTAAGMRGAGLSVRDTLPLVSLEKILARGISTLIGSILLLVALVLLGSLVLSAMEATRRRQLSRRVAVAAAVGAVAVALVLLALASPVLAPALLLSIAVGVAAPRVAPGLARPWIWGIQYVVVLAGLVASAYVYPQPLPTAQVEVTGGGAPIVGDLVATTDFSWYVAGFEDDTVRAIPAADIEDARFTSRERDDPPMLKDLVSDVFD